jgi:hypothetical protein
VNPAIARGPLVDSWPMADEMSISLIRLWCEVVEDANPVYYDPGHPATRHTGVVAPPAMIMPLVMRPEWTPHGRAPSVASSLRESLPDYPNATALRIVQTFRRYLRVGERPRVDFYRDEPTTEVETERGVGRIENQTFVLRDTHDAEIASHAIEILRYRTGLLRPGLPPDRADCPELLAALSMPVDLRRCIKWVAATRDFHDVHFDGDWARSIGHTDLYIGVHFFLALASRYVTDWSGPSGLLRRIELRSFGWPYPGGTVELSGGVRRRYAELGRDFADLVVDCAMAQSTLHRAVVTVELVDGA